MAQFKAALFDLDGTVFDTESQYSIFWGKIGREYRPDIPNFDKLIKGTTLTQIYATYFPDENLQAKLTEMLDEWEKNMKYNFVNGVEDFINEIRKHGVKCAIVTSSNEKKMNSVKQSVPNFYSLFDEILTAEMFAASKPNPDCYLLGAKVFNLPIKDCVVFEDAFTGLEAGMRANMYTVGLATTNTAEAIKDKCNVVFEDFRSLNYDKISALISEY